MSVVATADGRAGSRLGQTIEVNHRALTLTALTLASFLLVFNDSAVSIALPALQRDLAVELASLQWIFNAHTLPLAAVLLPTGRLSTGTGRGDP